MPIYLSDSEPKALAEAVEVLRAGLDENDIAYMRSFDPATVHHGAGMALRNGWNLWAPTSPLGDHFRTTYGLGHPDDMSAIILGSLWSDVCGTPFDPEAEATRLRKFWTDQHIDPLTQGLLLTAPDEIRTWRSRWLHHLRVMLKLEESDHAVVA